MDRPSSELRLMPDFVVACSETNKDVKLLPFPRFSVVKNWSYTCGSVLQKRWNHYVETANIQNDMQPTVSTIVPDLCGTRFLRKFDLSSSFSTSHDSLNKKLSKHTDHVFGCDVGK